jgi:hypothetical protein
MAELLVQKKETLFQPPNTVRYITEMRNLLMATIQGQNVLFFMPNMAKCILPVSVMVAMIRSMGRPIAL